MIPVGPFNCIRAIVDASIAAASEGEQELIMQQRQSGTGKLSRTHRPYIGNHVLREYQLDRRVTEMPSWSTLR